MKWLSIKKAIYCASRMRLWRQLARGVAPTIEHAAALRRFSFQTIVDIGANRGQFATFARNLYPTADVHSFEPLPEPALIFREVTNGDKRTHLHETAIGEEGGGATIYITTRDDSSSLLRPTEAQDELFGVRLARTSQVSIKRLSDCLNPSSIKTPALLKIDVQGGELSVLRGASDLLPYFDAVYVECSYVRMYEAQPLFSDIAPWMELNGFDLGGVYNQQEDDNRGAIQADFLFTRRTPDADSTGARAS